MRLWRQFRILLAAYYRGKYLAQLGAEAKREGNEVAYRRVQRAIEDEKDKTLRELQQLPPQDNTQQLN